MTFSCEWQLDIQGEGIPAYHLVSDKNHFTCRDSAAYCLRMYEYVWPMLRVDRENSYSDTFLARSYQFTLSIYDNIRIKCRNMIGFGTKSRETQADLLDRYADKLTPLIQDNFPNTHITPCTGVNGWNDVTEFGFELTGGPEVHTAFYWSQLLLRLIIYVNGSIEDPIKHIKVIDYGLSTYQAVQDHKHIKERGVLGLTHNYGPVSSSRMIELEYIKITEERNREIAALLKSRSNSKNLKYDKVL